MNGMNFREKAKRKSTSVYILYSFRQWDLEIAVVDDIVVLVNLFFHFGENERRIT